MKETHMEETRKTVRKPRAAAAPKPAARKASPAAKSSARKAAGKPAAPARAPSPVEREEMVRTAAYFRAERRGFEPGYEWEDWLAAEAEVSTLAGPRPVPKPRKAPAR
jgi:hypothetical protein